MLLKLLVAVLSVALGEETCASSRNLLQKGLVKGVLSNETNHSSQNALVQRRARVHKETELDSAVSSKFFGDIADGFESLGDAVGDTFEDIGEGIASVGLTVGSHVGNAAMVVGNSVVDVAESTVNALPAAIKDAANSLGNAVVATGSFVANVGEMVVDAHLELAGQALQAAQHVATESAKIGSSLGNHIVSAANAIGNGIEKVGALAVGFAKAAWDAIKDLIGCLLNVPNLLCKMLIGDQCDCNAGSDISMSTSGITLTCVVSAGGLSSGYGFSSDGSFEMGDDSSSGRVKLPGSSFVQSFKPRGDPLKAHKVALKSKQKSAPSGSCETSLDVALEGIVQFAPIIRLHAGTNGDIELEVEGVARAALDGLVSAQGSCGFIGEKRFPKIPKTKMICGPIGCVAIMLQMVAELEIQGVMTGSAEVSAGADFAIKGSVRINRFTGSADADFENPEISHQHGFGFSASAMGSVRIGLGPELVIFPMPGVPITINPMMNAEVRAQGTLNMGGSFLQEAAWTNATGKALEGKKSLTEVGEVNHIAMCGAAALNLYSDITVMGFGLPKAIEVALGTGWIEDAIEEAMVRGATALVGMIAAPLSCVPGVSQAVDGVMAAATAAAGALASLIPNLNLDFSTPSMELLSPTKLFCTTLVKSPGFDGSECSQELGCKYSGRPTAPLVQVPPAEQVTQHKRASATASHCYSIPMGDRFIQIGEWRFADIDGRHFSMSHRDGQTAMIYREDGTLHGGPRTDFNAWGRNIGPSSGIKFGFQFIEIGEWRIGAYNQNYLSLSHKDGQVPFVFLHDGMGWTGPRTEYTTWDRPEGPLSGVSFGDRFIQIGDFRLGDVDGRHASVGHSSGYTSMIYRGDGTVHPGPRTDYNVRGRHPVAWTCEGLEEMAHGTCDRNLGSFGDRFIQLGSWRLAAIDDNHFSVSHRDGQTAQIFSGSGHVSNGPRSDFSGWLKPVGFPYGITFGPSFVQIGKFRLGAYDRDHVSISHQSGYTAMIFESDGSLHPGPRTDYNLWSSRSTGPASGITFGDGFLQLTNFRIGDAGTDSYGRSHLVITEAGGTTSQTWRSDGHLFGSTGWSVANAYPKWHCGSIQSNFGTCTGTVVGPNFIQLGDWRLAAVDWNHLSASHRGGQTSQIWRNDGTVHPGPRTDYNSWSWEAWRDQLPKFGDRFIQIGAFRLGEVDHWHFSVSHREGQTIQIFRGDGYVFDGPRTDYGLWGRSTGEPLGVTFGDRFIQMGHFRVGDVDGTHFSVTHVDGQTMAIYTNDGQTRHGPRTDFTTFGRSLLECQVMPQSGTATATAVHMGSSSMNRKCQLQPHDLRCDVDAGDSGKRLNPDCRHCGDNFDVTVDSYGFVCAKRTDWHGGWGMDLRFECLNLEVDKRMRWDVVIGNSNQNSKCVWGHLPWGHSQISCAPYAGNLGWRLNNDAYGDSFDITTNGGNVCARRTDHHGGWGMQLHISCILP